MEPWVAANAIMGVHRRLVDFARARVVAGVRHAKLAREVLAQADAALALLDRGLGSYAVKEPEPAHVAGGERRRAQHDHDQAAGEHRLLGAEQLRRGATSAKPSGIAPVVVNQSSDVTRDSACGGISRPRLVSHSVNPMATAMPATSSSAAITTVLDP